MDLFDDNTVSGAEFSHDRKYRYALWRIWDKEMPSVMFIGLNPSRANESNNDNTITKVSKIAKHNGFGGFYMTNLFAFVTPYPEELPACADPILHNDTWLKKTRAICSKVVFSWGAFPEAQERAKKVIKMFPESFCLKHNKNGSPKHPLYCLDETKLISFVLPQTASL